MNIVTGDDGKLIFDYTGIVVISILYRAVLHESRIINKFVEIFRHIKDINKRRMYHHLFSFSEEYLLDLAIIVCRYL